MNESLLNLLLVDDEDSVREPLAKHLRADPYNYVVTDVRSVAEALRALKKRKGHFDVALIDEVLQADSSGLDLLQQIKMEHPEIECILFTGWGMQSGTNALRAGAYRYFAKPFNLEELALTIRFACEQKQIRQEHNYMDALVKASHALAGTTSLDEQLKIVWDFIREQLSTPTCFVALYDVAADTLRFPLSYDEGEPDPLPDLVLGSRRSDWGLAGYVVKTGEEKVWLDRAETEKAWRRSGIESRVSPRGPSESGICMPLRTTDRIIGAFSVQSYETYAFDQALMNAVRALGNQVAVAIENSRLVNETRQKALNLSKLQDLTIAVNSTLDWKEVLVQTCQAAVELVGADHSGFVEFDPELAKGVVVAEYPPDSQASGRFIPVTGVPAEEELVRRQGVLNIADVANETSLGPVRQILCDYGIQSTLIVPVIFNGKVIASFSLDAIRERRFFSQAEMEICQSLANQSAVAIRNARLYHEVREGREYLRSLYQAATEIISAHEPSEVLQSIVATVCRTTKAWRGVALLVGESHLPRILASVGFEDHSSLAGRIRPGGISMEVVRSGIPRFIPDTNAVLDQVNPAMVSQGTQGAACLPLSLQGRNIGVLWIQFREPHVFSETEQQALQLYANQSAAAYDNSRHIQELDLLRESAEAMASAEEPKQVLQQIAQGARRVLGADLTLIWSYDPHRGEGVFIPEELVGDGISDSQLAEFRQEEPRPGTTTRYVLQKGYLKVMDISAAKEIGEPTRARLQTLGVKSFHSIRLDIAGEALGVLHVDYQKIRDFGKEERAILEHFANHAALTLKKARLLKQVRRSQEAAQAVSAVTTLGKLENTLKEIVRGAKDVLGCDIVTVYTFDEDTQRFVHAEGIGFQLKANLRPPGEVAANSSLWRLIRLDESHYVAENAAEDPLLQGEFVKKENIRAALAIQLRFEGEHVGVMFLNYRSSHRFVQDEINAALQFGNQAAIAIRNAQLHNEALERAGVLKGIYEAGQAITSTLSLDETLSRITEQALHIVGATCLRVGCFSHIALRDGQRLRFVAAHPKEMLSLLQKTVAIDLKASTKIGIAGRAVATGESQNVRDVHENPDYVAASETTRSQLSVPLKVGDDVIGTLSIEHPALDEFTSSDESNIEALAAQAAIAIENARHVDQIEAMRSAADAFVAASDADEVLRQIAVSSKVIMRASSTAVLPYDPLRDKFEQGNLVSAGMPAQEAEALRRQDPRRGGIAYTILENGLLVVEDVANIDYPFISRGTGQLLRTNNIHSFLGVALVVGNERLGILYINYDSARSFTDEDRQTLTTFANQAALALKNAKFLEQQSKLRSASRAVAKLIVLGDLPRTLEAIVTGAKEVTGCDALTLYTYDQERRRFGFPPHMIGAWYPERIQEVGTVLEGSVVTKIRDMTDLHVAEDAASDAVMGGAFTSREKIRSSIGIPLSAGGQKVGVMFINYRTRFHFTPDILTDIRLFSDQAAIAIRNAQLHDRTEQRAKALEGLYEASKAITSTVTLDDTLQRIAEQALYVIRTGYQVHGCFSHIALLEENRLRFVASYPLEMLSLLHGETETDLADGARIGISGRAASSRSPRNIPDVRADPDYVLLAESTRSQLSVPLVIDDRVIGVLSIEHPSVDAFGGEDIRNVELLAAQAAVAIRTMRSFEELRRTKGLVGARTALAWMGMMGSTWRHAIEKHALTIREQITLLRQDLRSSHLTDKTDRRLNMIERLANRILEKPITPPLSAEEGAESVCLDRFLSTRLHQLRDVNPKVEIQMQLDLGSEKSVRISPEWLRRAFDILIDNAVAATQDSDACKVTVTTCQADRCAEIWVSDNGHGIPPEFRERIFQEPITKPQGTKGLGMGLLLAQTIAQTYGGEIRIRETGPSGTTMTISLPLEAEIPVKEG